MKVENNQVFSKIDDFSNKGLHRAEQNKFIKKVTSSGDRTCDPMPSTSCVT